MQSKNESLETLKDIHQMMQRSSRFISLSGLSGIAAGTCALIGAWFAFDVISNSSLYGSYGRGDIMIGRNEHPLSLRDFMGGSLFRIAIYTFIASFALAFLFTYTRSRKSHTPIWGSQAKRLMLNVCIPMLVGGIYLYKMMEHGIYGLIAPGCLVFYGLALVNASKYTLPEIRYLGYGQMALGIINLWFIGYGLYFWAFGFGILHILYGALMWWRYERVQS